MLKHRICEYCGSVMYWQPVKNRWYCSKCGNVKTYEDDKNKIKKLFEF